MGHIGSHLTSPPGGGDMKQDRRKGALRLGQMRHRRSGRDFATESPRQATISERRYQDLSTTPEPTAA
jgi:hypothetical protein